ncbi:hypothetical protein WBG78_06005 [Chryseolinea sp. T2]|uniref:hypothetical protein n=1 Tax=Chryseolinea sp. T2 TaxID=3129255 RepID=UPI003078236E
MVVITRYCHIRQQTLRDGDNILFQNAAVSLDEFSEQAFRQLGIQYPKFYKMDRASRLGILAVEILLQNTNVSRQSPESVAVVLSNAHASLDTDLRYFETLKTIASPALFVYTLSNVVTGEICIRHGFKGENAFFVTSAFEPSTMAAYVDGVMEKNNTTSCIAGWVDVLGEQHDVFLYLAEKSKGGNGSWPHDSETIEKLYRS